MAIIVSIIFQNRESGQIQGFKISPKYPIMFWNQRPENKAKVLYIIKNGAIIIVKMK